MQAFGGEDMISTGWAGIGQELLDVDVEGVKYGVVVKIGVDIVTIIMVICKLEVIVTIYYDISRLF